MYKVSVIVPTYNVELYLKQALDSLVNQTIFPDLEIIIINDGSTDNSQAIAKQYSDKYNNIKLITQENGGYGVAMNRGLGLATGEYIGILEPDDFLASQMYEDLYSLADKHNHSIPIIRATAIYKMWLKDGKIVDGISIFETINKNLIFNKSDYVISCNYLNVNIYQDMPAIWSAIYKRSFIEKNQIKFSTIKAGYQDLPFYIETIFCADKIAFINNAYYYYRVAREGSSSQIKTNKGFVLFDLYLFTEEQLKHHNPYKTKLLMNNILIRFYKSMFFWGYADLITEDRKVEYLEQLKKYIINYSERNKEIFNLRIFDPFRQANDKKYNDVEVILYKGSGYLYDKLSSKSPNKLTKLARIPWKIMKQPIFFIITIVRFIANLAKQLLVLTLNLRIKHGS